MQLSGTTILLTGATGGIGHAIARHLHRSGASLILTGRRTDVLEPLAGELGARSLAVDLSDRAAVDRLIEESREVDGVVANAALPASGDLRSFSVEEIDRALDVNLRAPMVMARELAPGMAERGRGHFVFISSLAGKAGTPGASIYNATKFGLRGFGQGLRGDLRADGIGVSVVFPGFIRDAGMFAEAEVTLPRGVGTSTPDQVAEGVVRAIERNKGEVDVAPLSMRLTATFAGVAPGMAASMTRKMGGEDLADAMAKGQSSKR